MRAWTALAGVALAAAGCHRKETPPQQLPVPRYMVGVPWSGAGHAWYYPKEAYDYTASGLAVVDATHPQTLTADDELYRPDALAAAHQTLQLPAIIRLTNLENGLQMLVRVNDRGPLEQGRLLSVTPGVARLLQMHAGSSTRVRVVLEGGLSRRLAGQLGGAPRLDLQAAPVESVQEQTLAAPGNAGPVASAQGVAPARLPASPDDAPVLDPLPSELLQGQPDPGKLWVDGGQFNQRRYADQVAAEIGGTVQSEGEGRQTVFIVREGPFELTSEADTALDRARHAGVTGARIIVE